VDLIVTPFSLSAVPVSTQERAHSGWVRSHQYPEQLEVNLSHGMNEENASPSVQIVSPSAIFRCSGGKED
jgi:hypothetical protein